MHYSGKFESICEKVGKVQDQKESYLEEKSDIFDNTIKSGTVSSA